LELQPSAAQPLVADDGAFWLREFFMVRGELLTSYRDYLGSTVLPFSSTGAHLIVSARNTSMTAAEFDEAAEKLARNAAAANQPAGVEVATRRAQTTSVGVISSR